MRRSALDRDSIRRNGQASGGITGLFNGSPSQIDIGDAAAPGVSTDAARGDHQHALPVPTVINAVGAANALGTSTIPAREDHVHAGVASLNGSQGALFGYTSRIYEADSLQNPDSADWAVNALAPAGADGTNTAEVVRFFDDTTEEGVGFTSFLPAGTSNLEFEFVFWANTAPGATRTFAFKLYARRLQNDTAIGAYTNFTMSDFSVPNNRRPQIQSKTVAYSSFGTALVAGAVYTFELTRVNPAAGTELVGDLNLRAFRLFAS